MKHLLKIIKIITLLLLNISLSTSLLIAAFCPPPTVNCMCPPGEVCSCADTQCACSGAQCTCIDTQCACGDTQCACADLQCACQNTQCACADPQCACQNTQCVCDNTQCACGDTQCACIDTQCACGDPQCACQNAQCACQDPQCACSNEQCVCPPAGLQSFANWFLPGITPERTLVTGDHVLFDVLEIQDNIAGAFPDAKGGTTFTLTNAGIGFYQVNLGVIARTGNRDEYSLQLDGVSVLGGTLNASPNFELDPIEVGFMAVNGAKLTVVYTGPGSSKMGGASMIGPEAFISISQVK